MGIHKYSIISDEQGLAINTPETLLQLVTPATRRARALGISGSAKSVTSSDVPMLVEILLQTTAGTASGVTPAPYGRTDLPVSLCTTCQKSFTAEPTASTILRRFYLTPVGGLLVYHFPEGQEIEIPISTRLGLRITSPQAQTVVAELIFEE